MPPGEVTYKSRKVTNTLAPRLIAATKQLLKAFLKRDAHQDTVISLKTKTPVRGRVLMAYKIEPFLWKGDEPKLNMHTNHLESLQIAEAFLCFGYDVDVISYLNHLFFPKKRYSIFFSARTHFQKMASRLNPDCLKIVHLDTAHWLFNNTSALERYLAVQKRKNVTLKTRKIVEPNWALEHADCATMLGNDFTSSTYAFCHKSIYLLPVPTLMRYPSPETKDFRSCKNHFLWLGSEGLVNKGLDLVLEAFAKMPDCHLHACGPIDKDKDFEALYYKELYETPNIHTHGWVDVTSKRFTDLTAGCIALIYPSCSEGQAGAVVTCLQAGLVPIVSLQSGVDIADFGVILKENTIPEISKSVRKLSDLSASELKKRAVQAWKYARRHHTKDNYAERFRIILEQIIANRPNQSNVSGT